MYPGDEIVCVSPAGLMGTLKLLGQHSDPDGNGMLNSRLSQGFLYDAQRACRRNYISNEGYILEISETHAGFSCSQNPADHISDDSVVKKRPINRNGGKTDPGIHAILPLGRSGFLGGLWIMSEVSGCGLKLDLRRVPVLQYTVEICEVLHQDPYSISSEGAYLFAAASGESFASELRRHGIMASSCGYADSSNDRLLFSGTITRYLNKPPKEVRPGI